MNLSDKLSELLNSDGGKKIIEKLKKDKKTLIIMLIGISGILLIMLAPSGTKSQENKESNIVYDYDIAGIQNEVRILIESIKGAGEAKVFITYENEKENVYAMNMMRIIS